MSNGKKNAAAETIALIQANDRALAHCAGHEFTTIAESTLAPGIFGIEVFLECTHCGGEVPAAVAHWYEVGLEHGGRRLRR